MKHIVATIPGRGAITALMADFLRAVDTSPKQLSGLTPSDLNRFRALQDKGLATAKAGMAQPTKAGREFLVKLAAIAPPAA
jgi:hypothetical protein